MEARNDNRGVKTKKRASSQSKPVEDRAAHTELARVALILKKTSGEKARHKKTQAAQPRSSETPNRQRLMVAEEVTVARVKEGAPVNSSKRSRKKSNENEAEVTRIQLFRLI